MFSKKTTFTKCICITVMFIFSISFSACNSKATLDSAGTISFIGTGGKEVKVTFENDRVIIYPNENDKEILPQVISGSGARFSNGKYLLWNKGNKITIWEDNKPIFTGYTE